MSKSGLGFDPLPIEVRVATEDILQHETDVLVVKYAQDLYGVDLAVYRKLISNPPAFEALAEKAPEIENLAITLQGPGYGLEEIEAFESEMRGLLEAVNGRTSPPKLKTIAFVEWNEGRAQRARQALRRLLPQGRIVAASHRVPARSKGKLGGITKVPAVLA